MQSVKVFVICMLLVGCVQHKRRPHKPDCDDKPIVIVEKTATTIHQEAASKRADVYEAIAEQIREGKLKTVNDVVDYSNPMISKLSNEYTTDITNLRKMRLHDADDALPQDAEATFRLFAKEYRAAAK